MILPIYPSTEIPKINISNGFPEKLTFLADF